MGARKSGRGGEKEQRRGSEGRKERGSEGARVVNREEGMGKRVFKSRQAHARKSRKRLVVGGEKPQAMSEHVDLRHMKRVSLILGSNFDPEPLYPPPPLNPDPAAAAASSTRMRRQIGGSPS